MAERPIDHRFRAMGSACRILLFGGDDVLADRLERRVRDVESRWSRFDPDSEISRLNRTGGPALVSPETVDLVRLSIEAHRFTGGVFEPLMLGPLERFGYDRDHRELELTRAAIDVDSTVMTETTFGTIRLDEQLGCVELPDDAAFDPGGIGKGLAADLVGEAAHREGVDGALIDLGGDLRLVGDWEGRPWPVEVADPFDPDETLCTLSVVGGGIATSSTLRRRWRSADGVHHHLLDPATGRPVDGDLVAATVHAGSAWAADVLAKAAVIVGAEAAEPLLAAASVNALLVGTDETNRHVGDIVLARELAG